MIDKPTIADPKSRYGDGHHATRSFKVQRLTGALNIVFLAFLIWLVVNLAGADRARMVATIAHPLVGLPLALLLVNVGLHMRIGLLETIDDYADEERSNRVFKLLNTVFVCAVVLVGLGAIAKIMFWG